MVELREYPVALPSSKEQLFLQQIPMMCTARGGLRAPPAIFRKVGKGTEHFFVAGMLERSHTPHSL